MEIRKELEKELHDFKTKKLLDNVDYYLEEAEEINKTSIVVRTIEEVNPEELRLIGQALRETLHKQDKSGVGLLSTVFAGKPYLVSYANNSPGMMSTTCSFDASLLISEPAQIIKGGGGGKPEFATAGGKDPAGVDIALAAFAKSVKAQLESSQK